MLQLLKTADQQEISAPYGVHQDVVGSWLHTIVYVRNICAHHARLWDRDLRVAFALPKTPEEWRIQPRPKSNRLGGFLFVLNWLNTRSPSPHFDPAAWRLEVEDLIGKSDPGIRGFLPRMGLSDDWTKHPLWK